MNLRNQKLIDEIVKLSIEDITSKIFGKKEDRDKNAAEREKKSEAARSARKKPDMPRTKANSGKSRSELAKQQKKDKETGRFAKQAKAKEERDKKSAARKSESEKAKAARAQTSAAAKSEREKAAAERKTKAEADKATREKTAAEKTAAREKAKSTPKTKAYDTAEEANTFLYNAKVNGADIEKTGDKEYTVTMPNGSVTKVTFESGELDKIGKKAATTTSSTRAKSTAVRVPSRS